jgi:ketosteroid isomerase-like protein
MSGDDTSTRPASAQVALAGLDHVRLSYEYLNSRDIDGYGSLFEGDAVVHRPGHEPIRGRDNVEHFQADQVDRVGAEHVVHDVFASGGRVAAVGRYIENESRCAPTGVDFADIFTLSENGLIADQKTYFFVDSS